MKKTYSEKLRDPRWQKMRLQIMERDQFTCQFCRSTEKTLNIHHKYYDKGAEPWEYDEAVLVTTCEECHKRVEQLKKEVGMAIGGRYGERMMNTFLLLIERDCPAMDFIMTQMVEVPKLTSTLASVADLYQSGYADADEERAAE